MVFKLNLYFSVPSKRRMKGRRMKGPILITKKRLVNKSIRKVKRLITALYLIKFRKVGLLLSI